MSNNWILKQLKKKLNNWILKRHYDEILQGEDAPEATNFSRKKVRWTVDWSELPPELIARIIEDHLVSVDDFAMISCVCHSWHRASTGCNRTKLREKWIHQMPCLIVTNGSDKTPPDNVVEAKNGTCDPYRYSGKYFDLGQNKLHTFNFPKGYGMECWGSRYGWIVTAGVDYNMCLFNPLTRSCLNLPCRKTIPYLDTEVFHSELVIKVTVLKVPSSCFGYDDGTEKLLVVVIYVPSPEEYPDLEGCAVMAIPGDTHWTILEFPFEVLDCCDAMYHNDLGLVLLTPTAGILHCKLDRKLGDKVEKPLLLNWYRPYEFGTNMFKNLRIFKTYIVEWSNEVLMVARFSKLEVEGAVETFSTTGFKVYKLDFVTKDWVELQDLQDIALFISLGETIAFQPQGDYECNKIYFTARMTKEMLRKAMFQEKLGGDSVGIYDVKDKSYQSLCVGSHTQSSHSIVTWFVPSL